MMNDRTTPRITVIWLLLGIAAYQPVHAAPPGEQLMDKVTQAYQDIQQYDATVRLSMQQTQGRWTSAQEGDVYIALDRPGNRLLIDTPDQLLIADGKKVYFRHTQIPGKHLEISTVSPLTSEWITQHMPTLAFPSVPADLAFLLSPDPLAFISQGAAGDPATLPPEVDDPEKRPRIRSAIQAGTVTFTIDPATYLIDKAVVDVDTAALGGKPGMTMAYVMDVQVHSNDQALDKDRFVFDTINSIASPSMQHMMASGANAPHAMQDKDAPLLKLTALDGDDYDMADDDAKVIILDFWATFCPPCQPGLAELQQVYDWVQQEGLPVAIYAVNQGESAELARQYRDQFGLTIPVLLDQQYTASQAYRVMALPETMVIANGKVQHAHIGYRPGVGEQMKAEIKALLAE